MAKPLMLAMNMLNNKADHLRRLTIATSCLSELIIMRTPQNDGREYNRIARFDLRIGDKLLLKRVITR
jgi:hypothetical protein